MDCSASTSATIGRIILHIVNSVLLDSPFVVSGLPHAATCWQAVSNGSIRSQPDSMDVQPLSRVSAAAACGWRVRLSNSGSSLRSRGVTVSR